MRGGVLSVIGGTPLVRLEKIYPGLDFALYAKLERSTPAAASRTGRRSRSWSTPCARGWSAPTR